MALPATDNFNRAGPELGANWSGGWGSDLVIVSSTILGAASDLERSNYWSADAPNAAQYAQITYTSVNTGEWGGVTCRHSATDSVGLISGETASWKIEWYNGGANTQIGSTYATAPANGDVGKITANGTTFKGYINGTERINGSNAGAPSTGYGGVCFTWGGSDNRFDDFEVGNLEEECFTQTVTSIIVNTNTITVTAMEEL